MADKPNVKDLYESIIAYYTMRPILKDMPHKVPRGPTPDGPAEHALMPKEMQEAMCGRRVLEVACGIGTRREQASETAGFVLGTDIAANTLKIARETIDRHNIEFLKCDAFDLSSINGSFDAGLAAGFFHICPASRYEQFLSGFHSKLDPGSIVFMCSSRATSPDAKSRLFRCKGHSDQHMTRQLSVGAEK